MESTILTGYIDRIYKFALSRTFSEDEADELSQEILLTAVTALPKLRDESRLEPWLWSLAANTARAYRRSKGKQRAMFVYNAPESLLEEAVLDDNSEELYAQLREKIVMLSKMYREIVILHYYDGLSTKQISEQLNIPLGTVTWRLSEARNKLKKEYESMEETALRPVYMRLDIYGSGNYDGKERPFPDAFINDALSQNILYNCYEVPKSIEELAKLCGVPAYYIEERMENLKKRCAVIEPVKGKYQTDFIIWTDKYGKYCEENARKQLMPMMKQLTSALERLYEETEKIDFYRAEKSPEELKFLYGVMAFEYLSKKYSRLGYPTIPYNYDGRAWRYVAYMESGKYHRTGVGTQINYNHPEVSDVTAECYLHTVYALHGLGFRQMMSGNYINVCQDILTTGQTGDEQSAAMAIRDGYILRREKGELFVTIPAFTKGQKAQFEKTVCEIFEPLMPEYSQIVEKFAANYKKLFPRHLEEDAQRMCCGFFMGFYDTIANYCVENGLLVKPDSSWICDVLVQWK